MERFHLLHFHQIVSCCILLSSNLQISVLVQIVGIGSLRRAISCAEHERRHVAALRHAVGLVIPLLAIYGLGCFFSANVCTLNY